MRAVLNNYGKIDVEESSQKANLGDNEILIEVKYAGLSYTDNIIKDSFYKYQKEFFPLPLVIGFEGSGIIKELGDNVSDFVVGQKVCFIKKFGAMTSLVNVEKEYVFNLGDLSLEIGASLPINFFTANYCLNYIYKILPEQKVLISGGSGGVGGMLVQLAKRQGLEVSTTVSKEKNITYVENLGAKEIFNISNKDNLKILMNEKFDYILTADTRLQALTFKLGTKTIFYGFHNFLGRSFLEKIWGIFYFLKLKKYSAFDMVYKNISVSGFNIIHFDKQIPVFNFLAKDFENFLLNSKFIKPQVNIYELKDVNKALLDLSNGTNIGKYVVKMP